MHLHSLNRFTRSIASNGRALPRRMWQAKCFEEQGEIGPAVAIYKELMGHSEPKLRDLQRHVGYFYIVALGKRKQYVLAADESALARLLQSARRARHAGGARGLDRIRQEPRRPDERDHG